MINLSINEFSTELASGNPTPGGGGACALVGSLGVSLAEMVLNVYLKNNEANTETNQLSKELNQCRIALLNLIDEDRIVFESLMNKYSLPKETEEKKKIRQKYIQNALVDAARVPLKIMELSLIGVKLHEKTIKFSNKHIISDITTGVIFCRSAITAAYSNVYINTKSIKNESEKKALEDYAQELLKSGEESANKVLDIVR